MTENQLLDWTVARVAPTAPEAVRVLFRYYDEIAARYHRRPMVPGEVERIMAEFPSDDLTPPTGSFLVARLDGEPAGCVGVRVFSPEVAELTRMFVDAEHRGRGGAGVLLREAEGVAREFGAKSLWLNTRDDLVEARALYAKHGYQPIPPYGDDPYAEHWFGKEL
ncbi:GNAT family N-acetyltransferase [Amycolatopsis magusensis]|uniref:GNAT superfamily N-acetyltransferase n=1 Tax=Amycolatopsis magusensis TaxID=882444 RepID=A0ABS4PJ21_9PSEU|nr:GNAT family N-acetyltransferase [Amycolatopsis magusensis]MBP2179417.1 GNAT superfamily N-acetyltransferase [Amycolatopsis magusensis]